MIVKINLENSGSPKEKIFIHLTPISTSELNFEYFYPFK